jgi:uncharacterized membrane protein YhfC
MNPLLILGPIGMILVGVVSSFYWWRRTGAAPKLFLFGGVVWAVSVAPKFIMDYTISPAIYSWLYAAAGLAGILVFGGLYIGARTGLFECGATYLAAGRSSLGDASGEDAAAFGIGFGATEAVLLAIPSLIQMVSFMTNPGLLDTLPLDQRVQVFAQLNSPTWLAVVPIVERAFTLLAHLYASLLAISAVHPGGRRRLLWAVAYKGALDAPVLYFQWLLSTSTSAIVYLIELWVVAMGAIGLFLSIRMIREWPKEKESQPALEDPQSGV